MSRSGYSECIDDDFPEWAYIRWRGAVTSAIRGKRGQAFLRELLTALDALPEKRLVTLALEEGADVCALGSVGRMRGIDMSGIDPEDHDTVAATFGVSGALAREIMYTNDEAYRFETPEQRFTRIRNWVLFYLNEVPNA